MIEFLNEGFSKNIGVLLLKPQSIVYANYESIRIIIAVEKEHGGLFYYEISKSFENESVINKLIESEGAITLNRDEYKKIVIFKPQNIVAINFGILDFDEVRSWVQFNDGIKITIIDRREYFNKELESYNLR